MTSSPAIPSPVLVGGVTDTERVAIVCTHCALPVPRGLVEPDADVQFCCAGCRGAYQVIHGCGLDDYYRLREASGGAGVALPGGIAPTPNRYGSFDTETFHTLHVQSLPEGLCAADLRLEGVHCAACVWLIEKLPRVVRSAAGEQAGNGVVEARLSMRQATVRVVWDPTRVQLSTIADALDALGYRPHPAKGISRQALRRKEERKQLMNIGLAGALAGNIMLLAAAQYAGLWGGMELQYEQLFRWLGAGLGLIALLGPGRVFFRGAFAALRARSPHLDLPIAIALGVGGSAGAANVLLGRGDIYFDSLAVLVFLLLIGRFIQARQQRMADDAVSLMASLTPGDCRVLGEDGTTQTVPIEALQIGDMVEVLPDGLVPADGVATGGATSVIAALLTGESEPAPVVPGDNVCAGTQVVGSPLVFRVTSLGEDTRAGRLMALVEDGVATKPAIVQAADRIAGWFVVVVSLIAAIVFAAWSAVDVGLAVDHTVALLIVACPCALGLATPLTFALAIGRAARRDILVKSAAAIERAAKGGLMVLDKTGTITTGRMQVVGWEGDTALHPWVAAVESKSSHPIAAAFADESDEKLLVGTANQVIGLTQHPDGIEADTPHGHLHIGSVTMLRRMGVIVSTHWAGRARQAAEAGTTPVLVACDGSAVAMARVGDRLHDDAAASIKKAQAMGWDLRVVSGDRPEIAARIGAAVGLADSQIQGAATPEGKLKTIRDAQTPGRSALAAAMVGDGVNDAAALAAADLGIAVSGGAEASLAAADVYLARPGLSPLIEFLSLSRQTLRTVRRNLAVSLCYNAGVVSLAAAGLITPLLAAVLMPLSSAAVLGLALYGQWRPPNSPGLSRPEVK